MKKYFPLIYIALSFLVLDRLLVTEVPAHYRGTADYERYHTEAFSQKMKGLSRLGGNLELIVLGDSRARHGVDPSFLSSQSADRAVTAYNLAPASGGIEFTGRLLEENLNRLPRLRTVVWGLSPRIFSAYWKDPIVDLYAASHGFRFDQVLNAARLEADPGGLRATGRVTFERMFSNVSRVFAHRSLLKSIVLDRIIPLERPRFVSDDSLQLSRWGYLPMPHRRYLDTGDADTLAKYKHDHRRGAFKLDRKRFEKFRGLIRNLDERGVRLAAFVPPMHRSLRDTPVADHDGTPDAEYRELVGLLKKLQKRHDNFVFRDFHRAGRNDFRDAHWANYDHLTPGGAEILTLKLQTWLGDVEALPAEAPPVTDRTEPALSLEDRVKGLADRLFHGLGDLHLAFFTPLEAAPRDKKPPRAKHNRDGNYSIVDMMREPYPLFRVTYDDAESGIDTDSVRIFLNDEDVTSAARVTAGAVSYKPKKKLETGLYSVRVIVKDKAGNKTEISWDIMYQEC